MYELKIERIENDYFYVCENCGNVFEPIIMYVIPEHYRDKLKQIGSLESKEAQKLLISALQNAEPVPIKIEHCPICSTKLVK